jgi:hypothetical protein
MRNLLRGVEMGAASVKLSIELPRDIHHLVLEGQGGVDVTLAVCGKLVPARVRCEVLSDAGFGSRTDEAWSKQTRDDVDPTSLVGRVFQFRGAHSNRFALGDTVYEAVEDENDGYRSMMEYLRVTSDESGFFASQIATVRVETDGDHAWKLVDAADGHVWLRFGTDSYDAYYPCFVFDYAAKAPVDEPRTERLREDIGELAGKALDEMRAKADENAKRAPLPDRQHGRDELWVMVTDYPDGSCKAVTITPLPMGLPAIETWCPCRAAVEPNVRHQYMQLLKLSKLENERAANERAALADVRVA